MAFVLVQKKAAAATSTNGTVTLDAAPVPNSFVVVVAMFATAIANVTSDANYGRQVNRNIPSAASGILIDLRRAVAGDSATITFTHASVLWQMEAYEFAGGAPAGTSFVVDTSSANGSTVTSIQPGLVTLRNAGDLVICGALQSSGNGGTEAIDSSFTAVDTGTFNQLVTGYKITTGSVASENPSISWLTARNTAAVSISLTSKFSLPNTGNRPAMFKPGIAR